MKTITKNTSLLFVLILGIIFSFSVSGQMVKTFTTSDKVNPESQFIKDQPGHSFLNVKPEGYQPVYKSTQGSFPQEIHHFYWDVTTIWMADYNKIVTYDNHGNKLTEITTDANTGDTIAGFVNTYDAQGRIKENLNQVWNNGAWENFSKLFYEYDEMDNLAIVLQFMWQAGNWVANGGNKFIYAYNTNNKITERISQTWDVNTTSWINYGRSIFSYDANEYLTETINQAWDSNTFSWYSTSKQIYTNSSGVIIEILKQMWDNNSSNWVNQERWTNIVWHDWTGFPEDSEIASYTSLYWNNGIWENSYRITITFDMYGGTVKLQENYFNGNWINSTKETYSYDTHKNYTGWQVEMWFNNAWSIDMGNKNILTYTGDDVTELIYQFYDHMNQEWINQGKEVYSDFFYTQGIDMNSFMLDEINLFPNPTNGILNLEIINMNKEMLSLEIVNINGQVVYSNQMNASDFPVHKIDLSNCSKGVYFVKLQNTTEVKVGKVILQ